MATRILNVNVGIMGHVDSGKTSLARVLSTTLSTAALDKSPMSQERGITLDLGFSAFVVDLPPHMKELPYDCMQITLVDCPGHASLIRTIIGGAHIIDLMMLVIDVTKGIQTQTAECIVIGEITCDKAVVVLNKIDQLPEATRQQDIDKMKARLKKTLGNTAFGNAPMVPIACNPGSDQKPMGIDALIAALSAAIEVPKRSDAEPFLFEFDHCFNIKGQGTVLTGTVLRGAININQTFEIPTLKLTRKVKSMQMFKKPVQRAMQGDRVGICVTQLDAKLLERGIAAEPGSVPTLNAAVISVHKVRFYKGDVKTTSQIHVSVGHETKMATVHFFGSSNLNENANDLSIHALSIQEERLRFDHSAEYKFQETLMPDGPENPPGSQFALLIFDEPITAPLGSIVIGSKLDTDIHTHVCRLAFFGRLLGPIDNSSRAALHAQLKIFKIKTKTGSIERVHDAYTLIGKDLFKKETDPTIFVNLRVTKENGEIGVIESSFGKSGKFKVRFEKDQKGADATGSLTLRLKKFVFDPDKKRILPA